jgi:hypothetical protein
MLALQFEGKNKINSVRILKELYLLYYIKDCISAGKPDGL